MTNNEKNSASCQTQKRARILPESSIESEFKLLLVPLQRNYNLVYILYNHLHINIWNEVYGYNIFNKNKHKLQKENYEVEHLTYTIK